MKRLAIIPARSGSKGLKDKNIIDLCGKPLMAYSIIAARDSKLFDKVIVSTDSDKYADIAESYGAEVMMRGEELSGDKVPTFSVIEDIFRRLESETYDYFALLQPTSPMRNAGHIIEAVKLFENNMDEFDFLVSVKESEHAGVLIKPIEEDLSLKHFDTDFANYARQKYKEYCPNGAIYLGKIDKYLERKHFYGDKSIAYIMNRLDSVDIDDELDYLVATQVMKRKEDDVRRSN